MSTGSGSNVKSSAGTPVKWTLVEAVAETPEGRRSKQPSYGQRRGQGTGSGSGSTGNWRQGRDGGRGRGGGQGFSGQGRGRGYGGGYAGGATYYAAQDSSGAEHPNFEEQKAYVTNMAVKQIEFYFTVENLCRDIFMRSYMDEEGYIPIAFVANFPGVARFGVELDDIVAGILASDTLQVDIENETMRMREGWEVWLLPNQATGKQGVPRYIKVDPATVSESSRGDGTECGKEVRTKYPAIEVEVEQVPEVDNTKASSEVNNEAEAAKKEGERLGAEPAANETMQNLNGAGVRQKGDAKTDFEFTPTAPAWTPGGVATDVVQEQLPPQISPTAVPPDVNAEAIPQESSGEVADHVPDKRTITASETNP
ncbi:unnamed protein product [Scytosiphon promiscuus]